MASGNVVEALRKERESGNATAIARSPVRALRPGFAQFDRSPVPRH